MNKSVWPSIDNWYEVSFFANTPPGSVKRNWVMFNNALKVTSTGPLPPVTENVVFKVPVRWRWRPLLQRC